MSGRSLETAPLLGGAHRQNHSAESLDLFGDENGTRSRSRRRPLSRRFLCCRSPEGSEDFDPENDDDHRKKAEDGNERPLNAKLESLDYDNCENELYRKEALEMTHKKWRKKQAARWVVMFFIGVFTALIASIIDISVTQLSQLKFQLVKYYYDQAIEKNSLVIPLLLWVSVNVLSVGIAAAITAYGEPVAAGSGIPQIKCYLNGIKIPRVVRIKTLFCKVIGVTLSVVGGLAIGKEGPMIHSGAVVAAGISQGRSTTFGCDLGLFEYFRMDSEKRDFVSGGAAAGVSAAFGAPVGGVLFSLEEGASFWNQALTWRIFFASMITTFTLNLVLSFYHGMGLQFSFPGLINFGKFKDIPYFGQEIPVYIAYGIIDVMEKNLSTGGLSPWPALRPGMSSLLFFIKYLLVFLLHFVLFLRLSYSTGVGLGALLSSYLEVALYQIASGLLGALFNYINYKLTLFRRRNIRKPWLQVFEAVLVAMISTVAAFFLIYVTDDCQAYGKDPNVNPIQMYCPDGQSNSMATLWFQPPESSVKSLFHDPYGTYQVVTLISFGLFYFMLACWTYGVSVPSGLFIPGLVIGASWGRLAAIGLLAAFPSATWIDPGKFALLGAAAQLGGIVRMTLSLTVILIEATGNITLGLPLMIVLMIAKWVGDLFTEGIYDMHIQLQGVPVLGWEPPRMTSNITARKVMSHPVVTLGTVSKVDRIASMLRSEMHDGFPVVQEISSDSDFLDSMSSVTSCTSFGTLAGIITRSQLIVLLRHKCFLDSDHSNVNVITQDAFRSVYPRFPKIEDIDISDEDENCNVDLRPFMNPAPYVVYDNTSLPRIFKLFRGLGLRHLVVINRRNEVIGIVTRKDLARYRVHGEHLTEAEMTAS